MLLLRKPFYIKEWEFTKMNDYNQTEQQIKLLARIFSAEPSISSIHMLWKEMKEIVYEMEDLLGDVVAFRKLEIMNRLIDKIEVFEDFLKQPGSIGKTRVGLLYDSSRARTELYKELFQTSKYQPILLKNNDLPLIHQYNKEDRLTIVNKHHHQEQIDSKELYTVIREFVHTRQMDLKETIHHVLIESTLPYEHLTFTDLNFTGDIDSNKLLLKNTDFVLLNLTYTRKWELILEYLHEIKYEGQVVIIVKNKKEELHQLIKSLHLNVTLLKDPEFNKVKQLLDTWNQPINNLLICEKIEESTLELLVDLQKQLEQSHQTIEAINKALLFEGQADKSAIYELRDTYQQKNNKLGQIIEELIKRRDILQEITREIENSLKIDYIDQRGGISFDSQVSLIHKHQLDVTYRLTELLIQNGEYERAKQSINKLLSFNYTKAHILLVFLQKKRGLNPIKLSIEKISSLPNNDDKIIEAKIWLKDKLALNRYQVVGLSKKLKETSYPTALYYKGLSYEPTNKGQAVSFFKKSFQLGYKEAGDRLYKVWTKEGELSVENLTFLGDLLFPEANYLLAQGLKTMKTTNAALVIGVVSPLFFDWDVKHIIIYRLSLASIAGHQKAASDLADLYMADKKYEQAIQVCLFAIDEFDAKVSFQEKLGMAYFKSNQFAKTAEVLQNVPTGEAHFLIGLMFEKGYGKVVNLPKALENYKRGKELGSSEAHTHYIKLSTRMEEEKKAKLQSKTTSYNSHKSYTSSSTSSSSSSKSCFLTTATCKAMGKEDNCEEILSFKAFRDKWLIAQGDGVSIIKEYYKIAPLIVEQIENSPNPFDVYTYLWNTYIQKGYRYLQEQEFEKAKDLYIEMVLELKGTYIKDRETRKSNKWG